MKKLKAILIQTILTFGLFTSNYCLAEDININNQPILNNSLAPMLEKVMPAVVSINVEGTTQQASNSYFFDNFPDDLRSFLNQDDFGQFFGQNNSKPRAFFSLGSGVIIDASKGYVITNNHVIDKSDKIKIILHDNKKVKAKLIGTDKLSDIAVLQIEDLKGLQLTQINYADSDKIKVGDFAIAIGNPFGIGQSATMGIISAVGRGQELSDNNNDFIQTDAAINRGNSGGPLLDINGNLVGINTAIATPSGGNVGIAFAIPSNLVKNLTNQIITSGSVKHVQLGIKGTELNDDISKELKIKAENGVFISEVVKGFPAEKAGIQAGDVLLSIDGHKITNFGVLKSKIMAKNIGDKIELEYLRNNEIKKITITLDKEDDVASNSDLSNLEIPQLKGLKFKLHENQGQKGLLVTEVIKNSPAAGYGFKKGDLIIGINNNKITSTKEVIDIINKKPKAIALNIIRDNSRLYLFIQH